MTKTEIQGKKKKEKYKWQNDEEFLRNTRQNVHRGKIVKMSGRR